MQTAEPVSQNIPDKVNGVKPEFEINVGKAWQIFKEPKGKVANGHPYFPLLENAPKDAKIAAEMAKLDAPYNNLKTPKGNIVKESVYADLRPDEFKPNRDMAIWATDTLGYKVAIQPKLDGRIIKNRSNPEYILNDGIIADRKTPDSKDYTKVLSKANKQGCSIVFIDLSKNDDTVENAFKTIKNLLNMSRGTVHPEIKEVYIVSKDKKQYEHLKRK